MLGIKYAESFVQLFERPVVICLGLGTNQGDHAGNSSLSRYLSSLAVRRSRAAIVCGGNEGNASHHYRGRLSVQTPEESSRDVDDLEGLQRLGVGQVGSDAHVNVLALLEEAELGLVGQISHVLDFVVLLALLHQLHSLVTGQDEGLDGQIFLADLAHLFFDVGQIVIGELGVAQIDIVVEAVLSGGAKGKVSLGVQALDSLRHDVSSGVADNMQFLVLRALVHMAVFVDDLHSGSPFDEKRRTTMKIIYKDGHVDECPQDQELHVIRHTAAHIMAQAIKRLYPEADFAFGPATENGFYYDVDLGDTKLTDDDLANIEKEMRKICKENLAINPSCFRDEGCEADGGAPGRAPKIEHMADLADETKVSFFQQAKLRLTCGADPA